MNSDNNSKKYSTSQTLLMMLKEEEHGKVTYQNLVDRLGVQAFGLIIVLFALPSMLPLSVIPGVSTVFSLPIFIIAIHLIIGKYNLWIPNFLATKEIELSQLRNMIKKTVPYLIKIEHFLKPRWGFLTSKRIERLHGLLLLILSILLSLPIPFSNFFLGMLIILFGFGLTEKDGVIIAVAYIGTFTLFFFYTQLTQTLLTFFFG